MTFFNIFYLLMTLMICGIISIVCDIKWGALTALLFFLGYVLKKSKSVFFATLLGGALPVLVAYFMSIGMISVGSYTLMATPLLLGLIPNGFLFFMILSVVFVGVFYLVYAPSVQKENRPSIFKALCTAYVVLMGLSGVLFVVNKHLFNNLFVITDIGRTTWGFIAALCCGWGIDLFIKYLFVRRYFKHKIPVFETLYITQIKTFLLVTIPWFVFVLCCFNVWH